MFDHVGVNVRDFAVSSEFYRRALEPLGVHETTAYEEWKAAAFGPEGKYAFWIAQREPFGTGTSTTPTATTSRPSATRAETLRRRADML
jgi:catechol 2,3-dioxygenase-like lactoylglutathione lyase family enzyme